MWLGCLIKNSLYKYWNFHVINALFYACVSKFLIHMVTVLALVCKMIIRDVFCTSKVYF